MTQHEFSSAPDLMFSSDSGSECAAVVPSEDCGRNSDLPNYDDLVRTVLDGSDELDKSIQEMRDIFSPKLLCVRFNKNSLLPRRVFPHSAGWDLYTLPDYEQELAVGSSLLVPLGVCFSFPPGYYGQLLSRSGLACNYGIFVQAGVIDPDYRGEVSVLIHNYGKKPFKIQPNVRICQMVLTRYENTVKEITEMDNVDQLGPGLLIGGRGTGGFGSSGYL